jgi:hypothetical protein
MLFVNYKKFSSQNFYFYSFVLIFFLISSLGIWFNLNFYINFSFYFYDCYFFKKILFDRVPIIKLKSLKYEEKIKK